MATTKINTPELFELESSTSGVRLPSGTTAQRPSTNLNAGDFRFNTDDNKVEYYDGSDWFQIDDEALPAIPSENFNTVLYAGNGGTQSITGVGFEPDFIWIKERNGTEWHNLFDSVRGADKSLYSNETSQEATSSTKLTSFDTDGFSLGSDNNVNKDNSSYVAWCWKAGGAASDETSSSSAVSSALLSANAAAGFSIMKYVQNGNSVVLPHGLNATPSIIIVKKTSASSSWFVYNNIISGAGRGFLNTADTFDNSGVPTFTSTNIQFQNQDPFSPDPVTAIMYCFADVAGYQKIGTYTGDGSSSKIVETGFEPAFVMIKNSTTAYRWYMLDNKRCTTNPNNARLFANDSTAETTNSDILNFLSNGFELITSDAEVNKSGDTMLYIAIASDPTSTTPSLTESFKTNLYTGTGGSQTIGGHLNGAAVMAGNGSITLPSSTSFDGTSNLSFSLWVFRQNTNRTFIMDKGQGGSGSYGWQLDWTNATSGFVFQMHNTSNTVVDVRTGAIANNEQTWEHVVVTFNPSTFEAKIYYNGILCDSATHSGTPSSNSGDVTIGTYSLATGFELTGSIDQFRFFNTVLTASQVSELYNETSSTANTLNFPTGAGCFAAYPFDSNANDLSGNYNASSETNITYSEGTSKNPSLVWIKNRDRSVDHALFDTIRGATQVIRPNQTTADNAFSDSLTSFNDSGFSLGSDAQWWVNKSGDDYVAWNWGASTLPTANSEGTLPSVVCINDAAGFSIVKYTGTGANATVGHGLEVKPNLVLYKDLDAANNWTVYSSDLTASHYLKLNTTNAKTADAYNIFNGEPDTSVLKIGSGTSINTNGNNIIAYCFKSIEGYSEIGTYVGTGQTGNIITFAGAGFEPGWIMIKATDAAEPWFILDAKRNPTNPRNDRLMADSSAAESPNSVHTVDFNSNGFTANGTVGNGTNGLNETYLYFAIK